MGVYPICGYVYMCAGAYRGQNRAYDPLELELQAVVSCGCWEQNLGPLQEEWCS